MPLKVLKGIVRRLALMHFNLIIKNALAPRSNITFLLQSNYVALAQCSSMDLTENIH